MCISIPAASTGAKRCARTGRESSGERKERACARLKATAGKGHGLDRAGEQSEVRRRSKNPKTFSFLIICIIFTVIYWNAKSSESGTYLYISQYLTLLSYTRVSR